MKYKIEIEYETENFEIKITFVGSIKDIEKIIKEECEILGEKEYKIKRFKGKRIKGKK